MASIFDKLFGNRKKDLGDLNISPSYSQSPGKPPSIPQITLGNSESLHDGRFRQFYIVPGDEGNYWACDFETDPFSGKKSIRFSYISSYALDKRMLFSRHSTEFRIGLRMESGNNYLTLGAFQKDIKFYVGDELGLIFDDGQKFLFGITEKGKRVERDTGGVILESKIQLPEDLFELMKKTGIKIWRYWDHKNEQAFTNDIAPNAKEDIQQMAQVLQIAIDQDL